MHRLAVKTFWQRAAANKKRREKRKHFQWNVAASEQCIGTGTFTLALPSTAFGFACNFSMRMQSHWRFTHDHVDRTPPQRVVHVSLSLSHSDCHSIQMNAAGKKQHSTHAHWRARKAHQAFRAFICSPNKMNYLRKSISGVFRKMQCRLCRGSALLSILTTAAVAAAAFVTLSSTFFRMHLRSSKVHRTQWLSGCDFFSGSVLSKPHLFGSERGGALAGVWHFFFLSFCTRILWLRKSPYPSIGQRWLPRSFRCTRPCVCVCIGRIRYTNTLWILVEPCKALGSTHGDM